MESKVQIFFVIVVVAYLIFITHLLKKKKLNLKYTLLWLIAGIILLIVTIFPNLMYSISNILGIKTPINSALILASMFIIVILIAVTSIVSGLNNNLRILTQEVALLEKKIRELSQKDDN